MDNKASVSIIIACFERAPELQRLLSSLEKMNSPNVLETIVVDDGSKNPAAIKKVGDKFKCRILRLDKNVGPAEARNIGVKNSQGEFLWFLDSDTEIENPKLLENMIACFQNNESLAGVGGEAVKIKGKTYAVWLKTMPNWLPLTKYASITRAFQIKPKFISTNNLMVLRKDFLKANGFSPMFDMCEDQDLCLRLARFKKSFLVRNDTCVIHHHSPSGRNGGKFWFFNNAWSYANNLQRARIKMLSNHYPLRLFILPLLDILFIPVVLVYQTFFAKRNAGELLKEKSEGSSGGYLVFLFSNLIAVFPVWLSAGKLAIQYLTAKR